MKQSVSKDSVVLLCKGVVLSHWQLSSGSWRYGEVSRTSRAQSGLLVFYPVLSTGGVNPRHARQWRRRNVKKKKGGGRERWRVKERLEESEVEFRLRQKTGCCVAVGSARAVGGRRLSSCDTHNQFFCKRQRGKSVRADSRRERLQELMPKQGWGGRHIESPWQRDLK